GELHAVAGLGLANGERAHDGALGAGRGALCQLHAADADERRDQARMLGTERLFTDGERALKMARRLAEMVNAGMGLANLAQILAAQPMARAEGAIARLEGSLEIA